MGTGTTPVFFMPYDEWIGMDKKWDGSLQVDGRWCRDWISTCGTCRIQTPPSAVQRQGTPHHSEGGQKPKKATNIINLGILSKKFLALNGIYKISILSSF